MLNWDSRVWQACVLGIWDTVPINDPRPYCFLISQIQSVRKWMLCAENDSNGQTHVHLLALTSQRSDSFKRSLERTWPQIAVAAMVDIEDPDPTLEIVKCQKCHKPSSLIAYMAKDPEWIAAHDLDDLVVFQSVYAHDLGERFRAKQELERLKRNDPSTANMHTITAEITDVIMQHNCKSVEDCMRAAPDIIAKHLHRAGLATIIQNCIAWVTSTGGGWSMASIATKYPAQPEFIHRTLLHQGLAPDTFDPIFYSWITKKDLKRNTIVLWGPSNTGKSAFISGLKLCMNWGEIVNSNTFAFEGLINTQLGVWEEPLISPELAEKAKQIFEGMETSIPVKYRKPARLTRIPIIVTTNHAPWRFCTKEEEMFKNRMHIFKWEYNMHNAEFICRASEHSCQCRLCQASRGSPSAAGWESAGSMQGREQPFQQLVPSAQSSGDVSPGSLPVSGTQVRIPGKESLGAGPSGCDGGRPASSAAGSTIECADSARPGCSTSSTAPYSLRPDWEYGSGDPGERDGGTGGGSTVCLEAIRDRGSGGDGGEGNGDGTDESRKTGGSDSDTRRSRGKRKASQEVVVLGENKTQKTWNLISASESELGGKMGTLSIPTRIQWLMYLSYLQLQYG